MIPHLDLIFLGLLTLCAVLALTAADLLAAVILFGGFSFFAVAFYCVVGALDVAFTEAALGAAVATVFFVAAIHRSTKAAERLATRPSQKLWAAVAVLAMGAALFSAADGLPTYGDPHSPASTHVSPRYIEKGLEEGGAHNMVTNVIVDYRGYDTLGETVVIFTAGLACLLILGIGFGDPRQRKPR